MLRNLVLILVFPCSHVPGGPFRRIATISYGLQGCIMFCTQKTTFLGYKKPTRMRLLVTKTTRECLFGIINKNRPSWIAGGPRRKARNSHAKTEITSQALFQVHKSKHLCCRTVWNNLSAPTEANTEAELEKEAWASPDDPSPEDLPLPPNT